jgi:hypothetical protein
VEDNNCAGKKTGVVNIVRQALGIVLWDFLIPVRPVKRTYGALRTSAKQTADQGRILKTWTAQARKQISSLPPPPESEGEVTFEMAMARRSHSAMSIQALERLFRNRKRAALGGGFIVIVVNMIGVAAAAAHGDVLHAVMGLMSMSAECFVMFALALSNQFRLWQLQVRRLSRSEHGGLEDFRAENPNWIWLTLSPDICVKQAG